MRTLIMNLHIVIVKLNISEGPVVISSIIHSYFFLINLFIYLLFLAALGLRSCARIFSSCGDWGLLFVAVHGLVIVVASLAAEHGL